MAAPVINMGGSSSTTTVSSFTMSTGTQGVVVGDTAILVINENSSGGVSSVSDTQSNTWVKQGEAVTPTGGIRVTIYTSLVTTAITSSTVITVNTSGTTVGWALRVESAPGFKLGSVEANSFTGNGTGTAIAATLAGCTECGLLVTAIGLNTATALGNTPDANSNINNDAYMASAVSGMQYGGMYRTTDTNGGSMTVAGTLTASAGWAMVGLSLVPASDVPNIVRVSGTNAVKATSASVSCTVPAAGHAAGNKMVVAVGESNGNVTHGTVTDSRGNTYTKFAADNTTQTQRAMVFVGDIQTDLVSGDSITYTPAVTSLTGCAMIPVEVGNLTTIEDVADAGATATSTSPSVGPITPVSAVTLMTGFLFVNGPDGDSYARDPDTAGGQLWGFINKANAEWMRVGTTGGSATSNFYGRLQIKPTKSAAAQTFNPALVTSRLWHASISSLQGPAPPVILADLVLAPQRATPPACYRAARPGMV